MAITRLLGDIISQAVAEHAPLDIVASLDSRDKAALRLQALAPDLVLIGLSQGEDGAVALCLRNALPQAKVIALSQYAHHAYLPCRTVTAPP